MSLKNRHNFFWARWINLLTKSRLYKYQSVRAKALIFIHKNSKKDKNITLCFKAEIFTPQNRTFAILFRFEKQIYPRSDSTPILYRGYRTTLPDSLYHKKRPPLAWSFFMAYPAGIPCLFSNFASWRCRFSLK